MANTLSVMTNVLRNAVSKQRIRYKEKGFNLDLAYICDNIIAMGYPADNLESIYRNRLEDVYKFLEENHQNHYKIYNLCLERSYDKNKFHGRVSVYPFEDHNPPTIELIQKFCDDVDTWLKADALNVAAVHCKAGKGRTGTMICCYLLYNGQHSTAEGALAYYDEKRTKDRKGVTIPSQRRYVQYFSKLLRSNKPYEKRTLQFCEIRFSEANVLHNHGTVHCSISVLQDTLYAVKVENLYNTCIDFRKSYTVDLKNIGLQVTGDIKVELNSKPTRKKIFHFWVNTYFIKDDATIEGEGDDARYVYTLSKTEIDDAHKDKEHKCYTEDFKVQLVFFVNSNHERTNCSTAIGNRVSNSNNHHDSAMNLGTTRIFANTNLQGHPMPAAQEMAGELSYQYDQRSSSSSASISSLAGGTGGGNVANLVAQINSGHNELLNNSTTPTTNDRFKRNSNGNATSANAADIKSQHQLTNKWRPGGLLNREAGAETLAEYNFATMATANNVTTTAKLKEQQHQYQPSENNVNIVPPSKVSRGSNHHTVKAEADYELAAIDAYGKTDAAAIVTGAASTNLAPNNLGATKNGIHHWKNDNNEPDASCALQQHYEDDDDDVGEDWESGESSAKSFSHTATGNLTQNPETTTTKKTFEKIQKSQLQSLSNSHIHHNPSTTTTIITTNTLSSLIPSNSLTAVRQTTNADKQQHDEKSSSNLHKLTMGYTSVNLVETELTNTSISCSSRSSYFSKAYIGGDNNGNDSSVSTCTSASVSACASSSSSYASFKNVVNNDLDEKINADYVAVTTQDDDNDSNKRMPQISNEKKVQNIIKANPVSNPAAATAGAIITPSVSRNKFFNFTLSKASANAAASAVAAANARATNNEGVIAVISPHQKQPFFRRKSFKSAVHSTASADSNESAGGTAAVATDATTCSSGLAGLSKQKLKIKLKKNRFKLAQKLQKFQNYLRADPNEFCENIVQQTIAMRRNSNCSVGSRTHRTITQSASATPPPSMSLSVSPKFKLNSQSPPPLASVEQTSLEHLSVEMDAALLMMLPAAAMHSSSSATASNASLGSSCGCDAGCGTMGGSGSGGTNAAFSGDDYYSSICDNQLSFNNSPCKSPRSLVDIALLSGGSSAPTHLRHNQHHHFHHQAKHSHNQQQHHNTVQNHPHAQQQNFQRSSYTLSSNKMHKPQHQQQQEQQMHKTDVVVVAAKPAKTNAIGFNVQAATFAAQQQIDCTDGSAAKISPPTKNTAPLNGFSSTPQNCSSDIETPTEHSSVYFTPPSSSAVFNENEVFESASSNDAAADQTATPFVFPEMSKEITNASSKTATANRLRENCSLTLQLKVRSLDLKAKNQLNKSKTPSIDEASLESIDHGNSSTGPTTGTSSSGFSNSDCCCRSGDGNAAIGTCNCNPFALDLERYAANAVKKIDTQSSDQTVNIAAESILKE